VSTSDESHIKVTHFDNEYTALVMSRYCFYSMSKFPTYVSFLVVKHKINSLLYSMRASFEAIELAKMHGFSFNNFTVLFL